MEGRIGFRRTAGIAALALFSGLLAVAMPAFGGAGDPLVHTAVVEGPAEEVWRLLTTKRGMESWIVAHAEVDLRVGGLLRTHHDPAGRIGDPGTSTQRILALEPNRMLTFLVKETPRGFPLAQSVEGTWYEVRLSPLAHGRTRVRCVGHGFGGGPMDYAARAVVDKGNAMALQQLQKVFANRKGKRA